MDNRAEVSQFLTSRRAKITPRDVGFPEGPSRRVPGLRRSEVAVLADISIEYYARLERGDLSGASDSVLHSVARALLLDDAERAHLLNLARAAGGTPSTRPRRRTQWTARPSLQFALDAVTGGVAFVRNSRTDIVAANRLGLAFYADVLALPERPANLARFAFLELERAHRFYPDWDLAADMTVQILRTEAGRDPYDKDLQDLIGELSTRSEDFRRRWGAYDVRLHGTGLKEFTHPVVGPLSLSYEGMDLTAEPGLTLMIYSAEPGSTSQESLQLLASWAETQDMADLAPVRPSAAR